jgi:hypothetical protein
MSYRQRHQQQSPFWLKRVRYFLSRLFGTRLQKAKSLHFVTINGQSFKRLVLCDSSLASEIEGNLESFHGTKLFPALVTRYEREIWVEFVTGVSIEKVDESIVEKVADFYATVYSQYPRYIDAAESPFPHRLHQDLRFLHQTGILTDSVYQEVDGVGKSLTPKNLWVGFDYTDPVLKNFLILPEHGSVCAIDVDGLAGNQLLGMGVAKACIRWLDPYRDLFFHHLIRQDVPDFRSDFSFIELCFLAKWTKRAFLEKDWKVIDPSLFNRFRNM